MGLGGWEADIMDVSHEGPAGALVGLEGPASALVGLDFGRSCRLERLLTSLDMGSEAGKEERRVAVDGPACALDTDLCGNPEGPARVLFIKPILCIENATHHL